MACYHPVSAWQTETGDVVFVERGAIARALTLPCGQCIGCRLERSRQWAVRILHEAACWDSSVFVTLTYDQDNCPVSLDYADVQRFLKRLRSRLGSKVRFFCVGEYGDNTSRPHYHVILFNVTFSDACSFKRGDYPLFTSKLLTETWGLGHSVFGAVTFESAAYCARYCVGKITGDYESLSPDLKARYDSKYRFLDVDGVLHERVKEFAHMSLKPGIGATWLDRFSSEVYPRDEVIVRGKQCKPPRYYDRRFLATSEFSDDVLWQRQLDAAKNFFDNSDERLAVRETVALARLGLSSRKLE